jgi:hypothetical protein
LIVTSAEAINLSHVGRAIVANSAVAARPPAEGRCENKAL